MRALDLRLAAALAFAGVLACGEKPAAPAPAPAPSPEPAPAVTPPAAAQPDPGTSATTAAAPVAKPGPPPAPTPAAKPAPAPAPEPVARPAPAPPPAPEAKPSVEPPAAPAASTHAKVGADKCKMCHRVQHQSWAASAHAKKGLDCEACHGNGGDYWPASVMRDRAKAVAAGLVEQTPDRCRRCHAKADASLLPKAHAHKAR
jgi:outer membrane biosynthesis protein TonB